MVVLTLGRPPITLGLLLWRSVAACAPLACAAVALCAGHGPSHPQRAVLFKVTCWKWKFCMCATRKYRGTGSVLVR
ncbi:hypothetical protein PF010_g29882 [Phytophthora fragariae]|uniref:RxLR effector protein n=1 Tax=Phytophthora fragariae TaxID=53985 RepID=A0A6A3PQ70_9STRA|nr:hypothetical protein PF003_g5106 [Phytophthora fragariae]KAE8919448.1 hypothetical protein PF009_g30246 [Phytophthora fragariae]KAE9061264.1 hypothetical protein PF010_g29882 [Phytophthora fragariae]KAE9063354.1 hypothetical protein PF007_g29581 [Phytophthora fragariae]KAE9072492.1 hypothetical protein PF006_g28923 [Phytophthora fragariae]